MQSICNETKLINYMNRIVWNSSVIDSCHFLETTATVDNKNIKSGESLESLL